MKRYFTYILSFVLISCIAACTKSEDVVNPNAEGHMALRLVSSTMTRATTPGNGVGTDVNDDNLSEDKLVSADLYFFDGEGTGNAVWHHREIFTNNPREEVKITALTIPSNIMSAIFNTSASQATLYVVANAPVGTLPTYEGLAEGETLPTMADLKAYTISTTSWKTTSTPSSAQSSFVMDGEAKITKTNNEIGGEVALTRAAAKIELSITDVVSSVTVDGKIWTPALGDNDNGSTIFVSLNYAVGGSFINGDYSKTFANDNTQQNYGFVKPDKDKKAYNQAHPFYSYASDWGAAGGANEPYLLLVVPWVKTENGSTTRQNTYYQIPVGSLDDKQIKRNHYYKVKINVGTMGSFEPQTATEIVPSYTVIDWSTGSISTDIKEASYLVVDENEVVMNNVTSYGVGYQSSHDVSVSIIGFSCKYYNNGSLVTVNNNNYPANTTSIKDVAPNLTDLTFKVDVEGGKIVLEHNLDNTMPDEVYHYFPYEITVQVTNPKLPNNPETIVFKQYPAMYVDVYRQTEGSKVMINGIRNGNDRNSTQWWYLNQSVNSTSNVVGTNARDIFTVSVSAFDSSTSQYIIGDPRAEAEDLTLWQTNASNGENTSTPVSTFKDEANNEVIKGYRATIVGETAKDIIAPKFIIASGYGAHSLEHDLYPGTSGKYRCATYQEAGYPAGRWRVPTPAELEIIGRMCSEGKLASIFYSNMGTTYLSTIGGYLYQSGGNFNTTGNIEAMSVRCVYDLWYWGDKLQDDEIFIWGAEGNIKDMKANGTYDQYFTPVQQ